MKSCNPDLPRTGLAISIRRIVVHLTVNVDFDVDFDERRKDKAVVADILMMRAAVDKEVAKDMWKHSQKSNKIVPFSLFSTLVIASD